MRVFQFADHDTSINRLEHLKFDSPRRPYYFSNNFCHGCCFSFYFSDSAENILRL